MEVGNRRVIVILSRIFKSYYYNILMSLIFNIFKYVFTQAVSIAMTGIWTLSGKYFTNRNVRVLLTTFHGPVSILRTLIIYWGT
ncbi:hypothetical protein SAMN04487944_11817 [Gracilibacillus ureilyticus]|uniref:Uncharacterized protein n=1 Tax=Gracilibacillus ureilyticus TaxID=531814 RepID=A0A1H9UKR6_9BACI|nr:hypothetical protein SAMN04487944_11817 [Gracilibacillus ureilyticus]